MSTRIVPTEGGLWQWDVGRQAKVPDGATMLHCALTGSDEAYATEVADGVADVPNVLLQDGGDIDAWATDGSRTIGAGRLRVHRRAKPPEYVYTATEVESIETVVAEALEKALAALELTPEDIDLYPLTDEEVASAYKEGTA